MGMWITNDTAQFVDWCMDETSGIDYQFTNKINLIWIKTSEIVSYFELLSNYGMVICVTRKRLHVNAELLYCFKAEWL